MHTTANTEEKCWELLRPFARSFITDLKTILPVARLGNKESLALESEIQLTESGIQLKVGVSTDKESAIKNAKRGIESVESKTVLDYLFFLLEGANY